MQLSFKLGENISAFLNLDVKFVFLSRFANNHLHVSLLSFFHNLHKSDRLVLWKPHHVFVLDTLGNVRLGSVEFGLVLDLQVDDEVKVVPDKVVLILMSVETLFSVTVKLKSQHQSELTMYLLRPQMKQMFFLSSSMLLEASLSCAKVSMMIPKITLRQITLTTKLKLMSK